MGTPKVKDVPPNVLAELHAGTRETANLVEGLALDMRLLLRTIAPGLATDYERELAGGLGVTARMAVAGRLLAEDGGHKSYRKLSKHRSDTVRGWAAYLLANLPGKSLAWRLQEVQPLAVDAHFGVREWAWLAMRPHVATELPEAFAILTPWTLERHEFLRRFAVEITRPRGVWCAHLNPLKQQPEQGLPVLEPLAAEPVKYVQDSVANWLNDAAKTRPEFVRALCQRWQAAHPGPATARICHRAQRSLR